MIFLVASIGATAAVAARWGWFLVSEIFSSVSPVAFTSIYPSAPATSVVTVRTILKADFFTAVVGSRTRSRVSASWTPWSYLSVITTTFSWSTPSSWVSRSAITGKVTNLIAVVAPILTLPEANYKWKLTLPAVWLMPINRTSKTSCSILKINNSYLTDIQGLPFHIFSFQLCECIFSFLFVFVFNKGVVTLRWQKGQIK